jgi:hypothetical protein
MGEKELRDFDPAQIRVDAGDDSELRESLERFGWVKDLPALVDEHGKVLVGNRRVRLAEELGIEPVIKQLTFGDGAEADAERIKLALVSNIGRNPLSREDRKHIAEYLYGRDWTMQRIAEALNTTHKTISKDLSGFVPEVQTSRPLGGRPKGSTSSVPTIHYETRDVSRPPVQIEVETLVSHPPVQIEVTHQSTEEKAALAKAAREEVRDAKKRLEQEFEERVRATEQRLDAKTAEKLAALTEQIDRLRDELREKNLIEVALRGIIPTLAQTF